MTATEHIGADAIEAKVSDSAKTLADAIVVEMATARVEQGRKWREQGRDVNEEDERAWALSQIRGHVSDYEAECFERKMTPLSEDEMRWVESDAHARLFGGGRLMKAWAQHPEALNMVVIGTQPARFEMPGGRIAEGPSVADADEELTREVRSMASITGIKEMQWDVSQPELELVTPEGDRLTALCWVAERPFVTLRRPTLSAVRIEDLVDNDTMTPKCGSLLKAISASGSRYLGVGGDELREDGDHESDGGGAAGGCASQHRGDLEGVAAASTSRYIPTVDYELGGAPPQQRRARRDNHDDADSGNSAHEPVGGAGGGNQGPGDGCFRHRDQPGVFGGGNCARSWQP